MLTMSMLLIRWFSLLLSSRLDCAVRLFAGPFPLVANSWTGLRGPRCTLTGPDCFGLTDSIYALNDSIGSTRRFPPALSKIEQSKID